MRSEEKTRQVRETGLNNLCISKSPKKGGRNQESGKGKRSMLACHTRCKCSMETTRNSVKVKIGIRFMKLVKNLIAVTCQGSKVI